MEKFIQLTSENIDTEHICCAFSDKKCTESYMMKKEWLKNEFDHGYVFYRLDERAKVFIEYGPAETAWVPITAENFLNINCFWVSGKYKKQGLGKKLLQKAENDALKQGKAGLVTVAGKQKNHFMSDGKWFQKQGFVPVDTTPDGFLLLVKWLGDPTGTVSFNKTAKNGKCPEKEGLTVYYSNRCPYAEFHVNSNLTETARERSIPLNIIKLETMEQAKEAPSPATIFSLFYNGQFLTTDLSVCIENRFDKFMTRKGLTL